MKPKIKIRLEIFIFVQKGRLDKDKLAEFFKDKDPKYVKTCLKSKLKALNFELNKNKLI